MPLFTTPQNPALVSLNITPYSTATITSHKLAGELIASAFSSPTLLIQLKKGAIFSLALYMLTGALLASFLQYLALL